MAKMKLQVVHNTSKLMTDKPYYVQARSTANYTTEDLVENIHKETGISETMVKAVLEYQGKAIADYAKAGASVAIPGLGTFSLKVSAKAQATEAEATAATVRGVRMAVYPNKDMRKFMSELQYEVVGKTVETDQEPEEDDELPPEGGLI